VVVVAVPPVSMLGDWHCVRLASASMTRPSSGIDGRAIIGQ